MESARRKLPLNPRENANFLSKLLFVWTIPLFKKGYAKTLQLEDIFQPLNCDRSELLGNRLNENWRKQLGNSKRPCLIKAIFKTFRREYFVLGVICFFNDVIVRLCQPFLLGELLLYFKKDSKMAYEDAILYASGIVILNALYGILVNQQLIHAYHNGMKVRVAVCSVIYAKTLRLSQTALEENSPGKVVNLLSNDVNRFDIASQFINSLWTGPLLTIAAGYLLWKEASWAGLIGVVIVITVVPIQSYAGRLTSKFRLKTALRTDERIRLMDEIISGVQVIKMYAWERPFAKLVAFARKMELKVIRKTSYLRALFMAFAIFTPRIATFCTMLSMALLYGSNLITADRVFAISAYFVLITHTMCIYFVRGVAEIAEAKVAIKRLQHFLEHDEKTSLIFEPKSKDGFSLAKARCKFDQQFQSHFSPKQNIEESGVCIPQNISVSINNATARWKMASERQIVQDSCDAVVSERKLPIQCNNNDQKAATLRNLSVEFPRGKLIGIIGAVGSGKSSLLQALLCELPLESGSISINGSISYASQEPWIFSGSVRQNIIFGQDFNRKRYKMVVRSCALQKDFEQMENGDQTIIGERGISLSGGQKARINLARSAYRRADIYLFDDPLSAVDAHVGRHLFKQCIGPKSRLAQFTRILITHQVHFLKDADWVVVMSDGKIQIKGSPADLKKSGIDFDTLIENEEQKPIETHITLFHRQLNLRSSARSFTSSICSSTDGYYEDFEINEFENEVAQMEPSSKGKLKGSISVSYFKAGAHWSLIVGIFILFIIVQLFASGADFWVSLWTKQEEIRAFNRNYNLPVITQFNEFRNTTMGTKYVLNASVIATDPLFLFNTDFCMCIYGGLMLGLFSFAILRSFGFYAMCIRASHNLHDAMFKGLISTTMRFFDTNPTGRILNRFCKDLGETDEFLPKAILDSFQIILEMFGSVVLTSIVHPWFLLPFAVMALLFTVIRKVYLKSAKNIKRLDAIAKSPVYTHLASSLGGLSTIRAYDAEDILQNEFHHHQDTHSACSFMFISTSSAFGFSLEIMCFLYLFCIIFFFVLIDTGKFGDKIGLAITQAMLLTGMLPKGIRQSVDVNNHMTSVERILEYRDLDSEKQPLNLCETTKDWPSKGKIEFRNVFYRYYAEAEPVLCGLTFVVQPMEKIGIVGRTGAGKSSLIGAIFRLALVDGNILIDDIDTSTLQLSDLRSRIAIIPQDPVIFSGTLRRNLDPFEEHEDWEIWSALQEVKLKEIATGPLGLHSAVIAHGNNFSVGQRQLLCLARAILRKNRILILDEATANVDPQTDFLIQQTIREKFVDCTVLTVAHRLQTIIDSDRVLVMDSGKVVEFDEPHNLLQREPGIFKEMVNALGQQKFSRLSKAAFEKYESKRINL